MVLVQGDSSQRLIRHTKRFLNLMQSKECDEIWNNMMTRKAQDLLSNTVVPLHLYGINQLDDLLGLEMVRGMALAFQMDSEHQRTDFFNAYSEAFVTQNWFKLDPTDYMAFATDETAVVVNGSQDKLFFLPFVVRPTGEYVIDWEALLAFSMVVSSQLLFAIGTRALVFGHTDTAELFFKYSADMAAPYDRLKELVLEHVLVRKYVTAERIRATGNR